MRRTAPRARAWPAALALGFALGFVSAWMAYSAPGEQDVSETAAERAAQTVLGSVAPLGSGVHLGETAARPVAGISRPGAADQDAGGRATRLPDQSVQRADRLVEILNHRVRLSPPPGMVANGVEGLANASDEYLHGWADALEAGAPELLRDTAAEIDRQLCEGNLSDAEIVVYLRLALRQAPPRGPALDRGLRCVLGRRTREDIVLWTALDVWSKSDLAAAPEWTAWAERATDARTLRRLVPWSRRQQGRE